MFVGARQSVFLHQMAVRLLELSSHTKGRYGPLCCMVQHLGTTTLLKVKPNLSEELLNAMAEQALAPYVYIHFDILFLAYLAKGR